MGLRFLEHILILTHDPDGTRDWFVKNLGFRDGYHPEFGFPVYWLYIGEQKCAFRRVFVGYSTGSSSQQQLSASLGNHEGGRIGVG